MTELRFDVVGAEGPKRFFAGITRETVAHAYLFTGPAGVGKKTFGRALAQSLLCQAPKSNVLGYDGTCSSCLLFRGESTHHPDFLQHEGVLKIGDRETPIAFYDGEELTARDLVRQLSMQSYTGGMRVALLGDVSFATHEAANALLKFLEEPPPGVVMILTSAGPGRLLPTIRSRAVEVRFPLLSKAQVREVLERKHCTEAEVELAATLAGGSVARALATLEGEEESLRGHVIRWFFESAGGRTPLETWATRETLAEGLETIKMLVRDWIVVGRGAGEPLSADQAERLRRMPRLDSGDAVALLGKIGEAQRMARTNVRPELVSDFVRMALTRSP